MPDDSPPGGPSRGAVMLAFLAIYLIWGSTFLAIRWGLESFPPFLMAGARFLLAGIPLYAFLRWRGSPAPTWAQWGAAAVVGALLLFAGNGSVTWAEQTLPSGLAALLVAMVPVWLVVVQAAVPGGRRPTPRVLVGVALGLAGVAVLVRPWDLGAQAGLAGAGAILAGTFCWATGSLYARRAKLPPPLMATAMEMLAGGALLAFVGVALGEPGHFPAAVPSVKSVAAVAFLALFGSIVAFSAYVWLLGVRPPSRVGTYAFVNPLVAVALGAVLAGEPLTPGILGAAAIILAAVMILTFEQGPHGPRASRARLVRGVERTRAVGARAARRAVRGFRPAKMAGRPGAR